MTMRYTIDTDQKTITPDGEVTLCDLLKFAKDTFGDKWKEWKLTPKAEGVQWHYPQPFIYPSYGDIVPCSPTVAPPAFTMVAAIKD